MLALVILTNAPFVFKAMRWRGKDNEPFQKITIEIINKAFYSEIIFQQAR